MLPEHVHVVKRPSGKINYYYQPHRGTPREEPRRPLPGTPDSPKFWQALAAGQSAPAAGLMEKLIDAYLASPRFAEKAANTQREYRRYLGIVRATWGALDPRGLKPMHIAELRDMNGKTPARANNLVATIGALYAWGTERGFADSNPALAVTRLDGGEYEPWPDRVWVIAMDNFRPELRLACVFALYTGQRLGDVLAMNLGHVQDDRILVKQCKTGKTLEIPLHSELRPTIAERQRSGIGRMPLVVKPNGQAFTTDQFHAMWTREMRKEPQGSIRKEGFVFHGLRKNACIKLFEVGCTEKEVEAITGQSAAMVAHYSKRVNQVHMALSAMRKLEGL